VVKTFWSAIFFALLALRQECLLLVETQYVQDSLEQFVRAGSMFQRKDFLAGKLVKLFCT
jgi:hypothetical protein